DSIRLENTLTAAVFRQDGTLSTGALIFSASLMMPPGGEAGAFEQGDRLVVTVAGASETIFEASEEVSYDETDGCRETCLQATVTLEPD
ncbi:MAG: hypothetical protein AAGF92_24660, partial [Myxococcota bacterium]